MRTRGYSERMGKLIEALNRLPGIGQRSAERIVFYLLKSSLEESLALSDLLKEVRSLTRFCKTCHNLADADTCRICEDPTRDKSLLCVVEDPKDVVALEKIGSYKGLYHVLLGSLSPLEGIGPEELRIMDLIRRVRQEKISEVMEKHDRDEILFADTEEQKANLWRMRRSVAEAVKSHSIYKEEDTVVPRAELPKLLKGVKEIGKKYGFKSVCYGHAGDGNLHVNIIKENVSDEIWNNEIPNKAIPEIFQLCVSLKGTLSGEHGIGWVQKNYMNIAFHPKAIELQKEIKKLFDPNGILNPGKMFAWIFYYL